MNLAEQLETLAESIAELRARQERQLAAVDDLCAEPTPDVRRASLSRAAARAHWGASASPRTY